MIKFLRVRQEFRKKESEKIYKIKEKQKMKDEAKRNVVNRPSLSHRSNGSNRIIQDPIAPVNFTIDLIK